MILQQNLNTKKTMNLVNNFSFSLKHILFDSLYTILYSLSSILDLQFPQWWLKISVSWDIPCSPAKLNRSFGGIYRLCLQIPRKIKQETRMNETYLIYMMFRNLPLLSSSGDVLSLRRGYLLLLYF